MLQDIHFHLGAGEVLALLGPSGCGKTTLLHLCAGLLDLQAGRLVNTFARPAMMFQQPRLLPWQNARDNIALSLRAEGVPRARAREAAQAIGLRLGLDSLALEAWPHALSGGMQSRVALGRALVTAPDLLLLDEPFAALDIGLKAQLHELLLEYRGQQSTAVLMITHDVMEAMGLADRILIMAPHPGRILHEYRPDLAPAARDAAWVHAETAKLLQVPLVRSCFELPGAAPAPRAAQMPRALSC
ncbi:MAG: ABC transporter ATP-binding protein [Candidatus Dactylopiibacterium carminicum]|uniref:ABC transporter ATP-binding protein n=2 Tax=Candidatus Dactylopiibacterium carminicum TaxID=857335 RepID=A0A272ENJ1_9RHOO|nr:ABC transporter ATP-binding protein [Candidatus Dactylopiibacterium carminicum]PAS91673.1 MAG: ABC transporter ATP-binding protein [Candidatus Dactylopiibacterium carminicum]PAS96561.1 MAG: ABC transporter ATP-binding protein [Candidatus Dactylopiibacterium carminicum]